MIARSPDFVQRFVSRHFGKRTVSMALPHPIISFTFDDFPVTALTEGASILESHGSFGTYFAALGLLDRSARVGRIASASDLEAVVQRGHELGCHTFSHCHSWRTPPAVFDESVRDNRHALSQLLPGYRFRSLSYPISPPRPRTKRLMEQYFQCCRGGRQTFNSGQTDLNRLNAFFIEKCGESIESIQRLIDDACFAKGWLIFATHDVSSKPTRFGCTIDFFQKVVASAARSGAKVLPISQACQIVAR
jgi:hypothetical protein